MFCTQDLQITEIVKGNERIGTVEAAVKVSKEHAESIQSSEYLGISTRSCLARYFSNFYVYEYELPLNGGTLKAVLGYDNMELPIAYNIGDVVARIYAYNSNDQIIGREMEKIAKDMNISGLLLDDRTFAIRLEDHCFVIENPERIVTASELIKDGYKFLKKISHKNWNHLCDNMLLISEKIQMPENVFGVIKGTTWKGGTYQLLSKVVDPGWNGNLIVEVHAKEDPVLSEDSKPNLLMSFYKAT